jgi:NADPH:quinone reductase
MPTARAVTIREPGDLEVLSIEDRVVREPGAFEVLVEVAAAGLNRADLLQRRGLYPAPAGSPPDVPGLEYAGVVAAVGEGVKAVRAGERVMGITGGGAMATYLVAHERELLPVPADLELEQAAAIPEAFITAFDALILQGGMGLGEVVLIHAAGSGVGTAAIQLCRLAGARPVGTSRSRDKLARCRALGLEDGIQAEGGAFADELARLTGGRKADLILDAVGAAYLGENLRAVASRGRIVVIGLMGGVAGELGLGALLAKRVQLVGTVLRSRPLEEKAAVAQAFARAVLPHFEAGSLRPVIDDVLPMSEIGAAHERMERNQTFGKLVMRW